MRYSDLLHYQLTRMKPLTMLIMHGLLLYKNLLLFKNCNIFIRKNIFVRKTFSDIESKCSEIYLLVSQFIFKPSKNFY